MTEDDLKYLDERDPQAFSFEDEAEPARTSLGWKFWCQALALALTAPVWGPVLLLFFGIDRIAQLWPKKMEPKKERLPRYGLHVILEDGSEMGFLLYAPARRCFADRRTVQPSDS